MVKSHRQTEKHAASFKSYESATTFRYWITSSSVLRLLFSILSNMDLETFEQAFLQMLEIGSICVVQVVANIVIK